MGMLNPTYGNHGQHIEAILVTYDESVVSYSQLTAVYWHNIDPTDGTGQFCDKGHAYLSVIYYSTVDEFKIASATRRTVAADHPGWQCDVKNFLRPEGGVLLPCAAGERVVTAI